jgi:hypothetical protein
MEKGYEHMTYQEVFLSYLKDLGIDISKWKLSSDETTFMYSEFTCRELMYQNKERREINLYCLIENFKNKEWIVVEFNIQAD